MYIQAKSDYNPNVTAHPYTHVPLSDHSREDDKARKGKAAFTALVDTAATLLAERQTPAQVVSTLKKACLEKLKLELSDSQLETVVAKARKLLLKRLGRAPEMHRALALGYYESILASNREKTQNKLAAQWAIVQMLGLSLEQRDADTPEDSARAAREFLAAAVQTVSAGPPIAAADVVPGDSEDDDVS